MQEKGEQEPLVSSHQGRPLSEHPRQYKFDKMVILSTLLCLAVFAIYSTALVLPRQERPLTLKVIHGGGNIAPALDLNFPDPSIIKGKDGYWYAFATTPNKDVQVQVAKSNDPLGQWEILPGYDALEHKAWTLGEHTWAPDVRELSDGSYILYFSGQIPGSHQHCIGVARSDTILGPYKPDPEPWVCPREEGGAIDASGFLDESTGMRYVVYKVDGNSKAEFRECGTNTDDPALRTPIILQRVDEDGATKIGNPIQILDRVRDLDGALVEAPNLIRRGDGMYVLFYSSHCFTDPEYDVKYAYSRDIEGPYRRAERPLLRAPDYGLRAPGGMTSIDYGLQGDLLVFHGDCRPKERCMYSVRYDE